MFVGLGDWGFIVDAWWCVETAIVSAYARAPRYKRLVAAVHCGEDAER